MNREGERRGEKRRVLCTNWGRGGGERDKRARDVLDVLLE